MTLLKVIRVMGVTAMVTFFPVARVRDQRPRHEDDRYWAEWLQYLQPPGQRPPR